MSLFTVNINGESHHVSTLAEAVKIVKDYKIKTASQENPPIYKRTRKGVARIAYS
jgi:hypothetical protein